MRDLVEGFYGQLEQAVEIANKFNFPKVDRRFENVVISGLGGSGIGGKIASEVLAPELTIPVVSNHHYTIPNWVSEKTLFIVCSYSGNTEETLEAMQLAIGKGAYIVCVTSGGEIGRIAEENGFTWIKIPGGQPPRSALGFSLIQILRIFEGCEYIAPKAGVVQGAIDLLLAEKEDIHAKAKDIAEQLVNKTPVIYSDESCSGVAVRWRQQLNENAKILCWHHVYPEMNHNELVGWAGASEDVAVIILKKETDHPRTKIRMDITKEIFQEYTNTIIELEAKGKNPIERVLYLINVGDWVSVYLSDLLEVDPVEVDVIDFLKGSLAKF